MNEVKVLSTDSAEGKKVKSVKGTSVAVLILAVLLIFCGFLVSSVSQKPEEGAEHSFVSGAKVLFRVDFSGIFGIEEVPSDEEGEQEAPLMAPWYVLTITETQVNSLIVVLLIGLFCFWLTRDMGITPTGKKQVLAEFLVEKVTGLVHSNMSEEFTSFAPFIAALMSLSALSSLTSLLGWYPPTAELNTIVGWSLVVFVMITYGKLRAGVGEYLKGYTKPFFIMAPLNVLGEIATPLSMTFRHFGNVCSGLVISTLLSSVLTLASSAVWRLIGVEGFLADLAFLRVGIPVVFSLYFDIFSGCLQAFIFCMLTMINVYLAYEDSNETLAEKARKRAEKARKKAEKQAEAANSVKSVAE